jgi:hypothetical protein
MKEVPSRCRAESIVRLPFRKEIDETFRSDRSAWIKMAAAALVADFALVLGAWKMRAEDVSIDEFLGSLNLGILAVTAVAGAGTALLLSMKDVIRRRMDRGDSVNFLLRLYLGMGVRSLVAWLPTAFILGIFLIIITH